MSDPTYPLFPIFAFLGFVVSLVPFSWHLQASNAGTCVYMLWTAFACLIEFVDSLVWHGNIRVIVPVWCDICEPFYSSSRNLTLMRCLATKFLIGAGVGIPASALCINRRLYAIASVSNVSISREEVRLKVLLYTIH